LSADEGRDDVNVESGSMVEISLVDSLEGVLIASIETGGEFDSGVGAGAEVEGGALDLCGCGSVAGSFLSVAVTYVGSWEGSCVGGVGACVVLDGAGALESGSKVDKGVSVDGEGSLAS
jgi:hypothetical protein